jgi:hypothetical protein
MSEQTAVGFTPGPWRVDESHDRSDGVYVEVDGRDCYVCEIGGAVWDASEGLFQLTPEDVANARLIAAAPDLYAALIAMVACVTDDHGAVSPEPADRRVWLDNLVAAREAIAKAEGR